MKKLFIILTFILSFTLVKAQYEETDKSQKEAHFFLRGGYSWANGVVGGEIFYDKLSIGGGWMPNTSPLTGEYVSTMCGQISVHSNNTMYNSVYASFGFATNGYQYEDSYGYYESETLLIGMLGYRWNVGVIDFKAGVGYAWCADAGIFTGEVGLGLRIF
jgi:hypothetical protein